MKLTKVKLSDIALGDNLSRGPNFEHTMRSIEQLADKIVANCYWDPPDVRERGRSNGRKVYDLIAGYKRINAAILLDSQRRLPECVGDKTGVNVIVRDANDAEVDTFNTTENLVRENLSTYQTAHSMYQLHKRHLLPPKELAERYGLDRKTVANYIRCIKQLSPIILEAWQRFDGTDDPIPMPKLYTWASLPEEEQVKRYEATHWAKVNGAGTKNERLEARPLRKRREIERVLKRTLNPDVIATLTWVLCDREQSPENL